MIFTRPTGTLNLVFRNFGLVALSRVVMLVVGLVSLPFIARYLGPASFGQYVFVLAFGSIFSLMMRGTLTTILLREMAANSAQSMSLFQSGFFLQSVLSLVTYGVIVSAGYLLVYEPDIVVGIVLVGLAHSLISFQGVPTAAFYARENMHHEALLTGTERTFFLAIILLAIWRDWGLFGLFCALLVSQSLRLFLALFLVRDILRNFQVNWSVCQRLFRATALLCVGGAFYALSWRSELFLLQLFRGDASVGIFAGPFKILELSRLVSAGLVVAFLPSLSRLAESNDIGNYVTIARFASKMILVMGIFVGFMVWAFAPEMRHILLGEVYEPADPVFRTLAVAFPLTFVGHYCEGLLVALGRPNLLILTRGFSMAFRVSAGLLLIPLFDFRGAAVVVVGGELCLLVVALYLLSRESNHIGMNLISRRAIVLGLLLTGAGQYLGALDFGLRIVVILSAYIILFFSCRIVSRAETQLVEAAMTNPKVQVQTIGSGV